MITYAHKDYPQATVALENSENFYLKTSNFYILIWNMI